MPQFRQELTSREKLRSFRHLLSRRIECKHIYSLSFSKNQCSLIFKTEVFSLNKQKRFFSIKAASLHWSGAVSALQCYAMPVVERILTCFSFFPSCNSTTSFTLLRCNGSMPKLCNKLGQKREPSKLHLLNPVRATFRSVWILTK